MKKVRAILHAEYRRTLRAYKRHIKDNDCKLDSSGCTDRAKFQERLATLGYAIGLAGGRNPGSMGNGVTTLDDLGA